MFRDLHWIGRRSTSECLCRSMLLGHVVGRRAAEVLVVGMIEIILCSLGQRLDYLRMEGELNWSSS